MNAIWENTKKFGAYVLAFIAGLILWIDPSHIDNLVAAHPKWSGVILFVWTALLSWAGKLKPTPSEPSLPSPPQTYNRRSA